MAWSRNGAVASTICLMVACGGGIALSPSARNLVVANRPAPVGARRVGPVEVVSGKGCGNSGEVGSADAALKLLRVEGASRGADYLELKSVEQSNDPATCNQYRAHAVAWDTTSVALKIQGPPSQSESAAGESAAGAPAKSSAEATPSRLPAPVGTPRYALGFDTAVDGCLKGQVYAQPKGQTRLTGDYAEAPPSAALWGCEWNVNGQKLSEALPGAAAEQAYAVRYQGTFQVGASGVFKFGMVASSDARIVVDGAALIESGRSASASADQRAVYLGAGRHQVLIEYLAAGTALSFQIGVTLPGATQTVPFSMRPSGAFYAEQGLDYTGPAGSTGDEWRKLVDVKADQLKLNGRVYFRTTSAELDQMDQTENALLAVAKTLKEQKNVPCVEIEGHTDNRGDTQGNLRLSRERADAVREWLVQAGVEPHRLMAVGFGGERPLASNESDAGRANNRRVEFLLRTPDASGACPRSAAPGGASRLPLACQVPAELAEKACNASSTLRSKLLTELEPWLTEHRGCAVDADCTQAIPLECPGKSRALDCAWVLVNQSSIDSLRVTGARLDSVSNYCKRLPDDGLVRSCGGCAAKSRHCQSGSCQLGAR